MDCFYCIVSTAEDAVADLCVPDAGDDRTALDWARAVAESVPGWARVSVYAGELRIGQIERETATPGWPLAA